MYVDILTDKCFISCHVLLSYFRFLQKMKNVKILNFTPHVAMYSFPISDFFYKDYDELIALRDIRCHVLLSYFRFLPVISKMTLGFWSVELPCTPFLFPISSTQKTKEYLQRETQLPCTPFLFPISSKAPYLGVLGGIIVAMYSFPISDFFNW